MIKTGERIFHNPSATMPLVAAEEHTCKECGKMILVGEHTRPMISDVTNETNQSKPVLHWAHLYCVDQDDERVPICKHWKKRGCMYRDKCYFRHPSMLESRVGELSHDGSDAKQDTKKERCRSRQRRRVYNEGRCGAVRRWCIRVFGEEYLKECGSGVLDVAGGKGELAFEFLNLNGVMSTVVDPRSMDLYRYKRKLRFGYYHKNDVLGIYNTEPKPSEESSIKLPTHIRSFFEMPGVAEGSSATDPDTYCSPSFLHSEDEFTSALVHGAKTCWTLKGLSHEDDMNYENEEVDSVMSETTIETITTTNTGGHDGYKNRTDHGGIAIDCFSVARELVLKSSLLVGMHPDQAAEHIVEFSLRNNIPFCVIPCCVYSKQFPKRKLKDGAYYLN